MEKGKMNIPRPVPLNKLKIGKIFFEEITNEKEKTSKIELGMHLFIIKINALQVSDSESHISYFWSYLERFSVFSDIVSFSDNNEIETISNTRDSFYKDYIKTDVIINRKFMIRFFDFDITWFLENKKKILLHSAYCKTFPELFRSVRNVRERKNLPDE